jgi:hypothetical protein
LLVLRILGLLAVITIAASLAMYLFTRQRRYLTIALRVTQVTVGAALVAFALLLFERLAVLV